MINSFIDYIKNTRNMADNTAEAYRRDIEAYDRFLSSQGAALDTATNTNVVSYLIELKNNDLSKATVNRKLASIRAFYKYLYSKGLISENPAEDIKSPKIARKEVEYITIEEVERLLSAPDDSVKGKRDRAILEVLYATGIRVSELIELKLMDVNLKMGFVSLSGKHGKARIVPIGRYARDAVIDYLENSRKGILRSEDADSPTSILFPNYKGEPFTRQGFWKLLKAYGKTAGLEGKLTPQTLRNSFAMHMVQNGIDIKTLQELMGHEDISATQIYFGNVRNRIKDIYDRTHPRAK